MHVYLIVALAAAAGAVIGVLRARRRGGRPADLAQYAAGHAIAFAIGAVVVTTLLARLA